MTHRAASAAYAALFGEIVAGPSTVNEMVDASGMHINTVRKFVAAAYRIKLLETTGMAPGKTGRLQQKVHALRGWKRNKR